MKIEKINDNQIRCTLTRDDLAAHQLKLSELAYGTEKAKSLFHDLMQQASNEFGFEANDIPLMVEAMPGAADSIVLVITKVDNPDDLDSKFSKFGTSALGDSDRKSSMLERLKKLDGAEDVLDLLRHVTESAHSTSETAKEVEKTEEKNAEKEDEDFLPSLRFFSFATLDSAIRASVFLKNIYDGSNTLYKDEMSDLYILTLTQSDYSSTDFNRICNMLSEYGCAEPGNGATLAFLEEHGSVIVAQNAVQTLGNL